MALFEALLSLAESSSQANAGKKDGPLIDSAIFISLPQAPSKAQWTAVRSVVGRRVVNAYVKLPSMLIEASHRGMHVLMSEYQCRYCKSDFVLAGVGRLHEVLGGAHLGGMAGLEATSPEVAGIENVDLKDVIGGTCVQSIFTKLLRLLLPDDWLTTHLCAHTGHFDIAEKLPAILEKIGVDR